MRLASNEGGTTESSQLDVRTSGTRKSKDPKIRRPVLLFTPDAEDTSDQRSSAEASSSNLLIPTIFHESWWLDAATDGNFSIVEVSSGNKTVGRLPFAMSSRCGLRGIWTPPLTHFLGPGIDEGNGNSISRFLRRIEITRQLIERLPKSSWQCFRCHRGMTDVIAFQEESFKTYAQFTHEIEPGPADCLWQQMRDKTRNVIRKAEEQLKVKELFDPEEFVAIYKKHLSSRRVHNTLDMAAANRVVRASLEHQHGRVLGAVNAQGEIVAANFCAWDSNASYYVACTRSETAGNGAISLLVWEAIQHAAKNGLVFDFSGLGTRGSILHYAGFGAAIGTRFVAVRASLIGKVVARARALFAEEHFLY
jgi:hypothetical protein